MYGDSGMVGNNGFMNFHKIRFTAINNQFY